jgi:hypothetical protein
MRRHLIAMVLLAAWSTPVDAGEPIRASTLKRVKLSAPHAEAFLKYVHQEAARTKIPKKFKHPTVFFVKESDGSTVVSRVMHIRGADMTGDYGVEYFESRSQGFELAYSMQTDLPTLDDLFDQEFKLLEVLFRRFLLQRGFEPVPQATTPPPGLRLRRHATRSLLDVRQGDRWVSYDVSNSHKRSSFEEVTACRSRGDLKIANWVQLGERTVLLVVVPWFEFGSEGDGWCSHKVYMAEVERSGSKVVVKKDSKRLKAR